MIPARLSRLIRYPAAAALVASLAGGSIGAIPASAALTYSTDTPMILTNVSPEDLWANTRGVCNGSFNIVVRNVLGATNALNECRRRPLRRATLMRMAEIYAERFADPDGRVRASFEIVWLSGWAPHPSQQQPLAPGSAKTRLADALGTSELSTGAKAGR